MASWNGIFHLYARGSRVIGLGVTLALAGVVMIAPGGCTLDREGVSAGGGGASSTSTSTGGCTTEAGCTPCVSNADCGMPTFDGCTVSTCVALVCTPKVTTGQLSTTQTSNDCMKSVCGTDGKPVLVEDPGDTPADDMNVCTDELCVGGTPTKMPAASGTICPGGTCDGAGACFNCNEDSDCTMGTTPTCDMSAHTCISCSDGIKNGSETAVDCGGNCKKCNGDTCGKDDDCASSQCADKICCDTACTGECQACNVAGSPGVCSSVPLGDTDPMTCMDPALVACDGAGACKRATGRNCMMDDECASNTCLAGFCRAPTGSACVDDFLCASQRCTSGKCADCSVGADCPTTMMCSTPICKAPGGAPCDVDMDCAQGSCQNGLCKLDNDAACITSLDCLSGQCKSGFCKPCNNNGDCPGSSCGNGFCRLPKDAYCFPMLPADLGCHSGNCQGFPAKCK